MEGNTIDNKRITKNAIVLYIRMLVSMAVVFYTSRVILEVLGVEDFGIYNVVGGATAIILFFSGSLTNAAQRYFNLSLGREDKEETNKYFNQFILIFTAISLVVLIVGECMASWIVKDFLVIPLNRVEAAYWVYQFSLFTLILTMLQTPFVSSVIAHERMNVYAYVSLGETCSRLVILYVIRSFGGDYLVHYALGIFMVSVVVFSSYILYNLKRFPECKLRYYFNLRLAKEMAGFISYNVFGCFAFSMSTQGMNVILNLFFGPTINAARAVAIQVYQGVYRFADNIVVAIKPPIIKLYAMGDTDRMIDMAMHTTRYCLFVNTLLVLPILFNVDFILSAWLGTVPNYTNVFVIVVLIENYFNIMNQAITILVNATGRLKRNQFYGRMYTLCVLPLAYFSLLLVREPLIPILLTLFGSICYFMNNLYDVRLQFGLSIRKYIKVAIVPVIKLLFPLIVCGVVTIVLIDKGGMRLFVIGLLDITLGTFIIYRFLFSQEEKNFVASKVQQFIKTYQVKRKK